MAREFRVYNKDQLLMEGASPLNLSNLTPHTTYDLEITTWDGKLESERVPVPKFTTLREQLVTGFNSPYRSTDYLVGTWTAKKPLRSGKVYMVELEGTKPFSQNFGFYLGTNLVGYFVPKNTGGNRYTMVFTNAFDNATELKVYQYPSGTAGQVELTKFSVVEIDVSENLLGTESLSKLPISTTDYSVFEGTLTKDWEYGKRYYVRIKGSKLASQNFTLYVDGGTTNMGNASNINGTDIWEATFTVNQYAINRGAKRTFMIYQTPASTKGQVDISEIMVLETNEAVLPTSIKVNPNVINIKVGEAYNSAFELTPPDAENYGLVLSGWVGTIASNSNADPVNRFTGRGSAVGSFTAILRSSADPIRESLVTVNVTDPSRPNLLPTFNFSDIKGNATGTQPPQPEITDAGDSFLITNKGLNKQVVGYIPVPDLKLKANTKYNFIADIKSSEDSVEPQSTQILIRKVSDNSIIGGAINSTQNTKLGYNALQREFTLTEDAEGLYIQVYVTAPVDGTQNFKYNLRLY